MNFYQILEIEQQATLEQIRKAYKKLAFLYHPDKTTMDKVAAEEKFKEISAAHEFLIAGGNQKKIYDQVLRKGHRHEQALARATQEAVFQNDEEDFKASVFKSYSGTQRSEQHSKTQHSENSRTKHSSETSYSKQPSDSAFKEQHSKNSHSKQRSDSASKEKHSETSNSKLHSEAPRSNTSHSGKPAANNRTNFYDNSFADTFGRTQEESKENGYSSFNSSPFTLFQPQNEYGFSSSPLFAALYVLTLLSYLQQTAFSASAASVMFINVAPIIVFVSARDEQDDNIYSYRFGR